jgi:P pilus assembly chaperone PapD
MTTSDLSRVYDCSRWLCDFNCDALTSVAFDESHASEKFEVRSRKVALPYEVPSWSRQRINKAQLTSRERFVVARNLVRLFD